MVDNSLRVDVCIGIVSEADLVTARKKGRDLAGDLDFSSLDATLIATAISELGRNILRYARDGEILLSPTTREARNGMIIVARDHGPGIVNVEQAMQDGFSTSHGMGMGLPGTKRLMDEFHIDSVPGKGTTVTIKRWVRTQEARPLLARR